jgi:hypothetical protein
VFAELKRATQEDEFSSGMQEDAELWEKALILWGD